MKGPNFTQNGIIIPMLLIKAIFVQAFFNRRYIFQLTKYEHKGVRESIDFDDTNLSFVGLAE